MAMQLRRGKQTNTLHILTFHRKRGRQRNYRTFRFVRLLLNVTYFKNLCCPLLKKISVFKAKGRSNYKDAYIDISYIIFRI